MAPEQSKEATATVGQLNLQDVFDAYGAVERAAQVMSERRATVRELKEQLKEAKEEATAAEVEYEKARDEVLLIVAGIRPKDTHPMGWIDETTRPGRKFVLKDPDIRLRFDGITDGKVRMTIIDGLMDGENFFPAGDRTVEEWNGEWAAKVEGYTDVKEGTVDNGQLTMKDPEPLSTVNSQLSTDDAWKSVRLVTLANPPIPDKVLHILYDHEPRVETLGDLAAVATDGFWAKKFKGIGPAAQTQIDDAVAAYWTRKAKEGPGL